MFDKSASFLDFIVQDDKGRAILAEFKDSGYSLLVLSFNGHHALGSTPEEKWFERLKRRPDKSLGEIMSRREVLRYIKIKLARCMAEESKSEFLKLAEKFQKEVSYFVKIGKLPALAEVLASKLNAKEPTIDPQEVGKALDEIRLELLNYDGEKITAQLKAQYGIEFKYRGPQLDHGKLVYYMIDDPVTGTPCTGKSIREIRDSLTDIRRSFNVSLP